MAFILKLYSLFAASCMLFIVFTCEQGGIIAASLSFTMGAVLLLSFTGPKATYSQDGEGRYFATFTYKGIQYKETANGCQMFVSGEWLPVGVCPVPSIANKVRGMNEKPDKSNVATLIALVVAAVAMAPALFPSVLSTPAIVSQLSGMAAVLNIGIVTMAVIAVIAVAIWLIGGVRVKYETGPFAMQVETMELPEFAPNNKDFAIIGTVDGETAEQYGKRAKAALDGGANLTIVAPKGGAVWLVRTPTVDATVNRIEGSEPLGVIPVKCPQIECEAEYKRNLGTFFSACLAYFGTNSRIAERIAQSDDPANDILAQVGTFCFALLFALPVFAQNNSAQALDYLGESFEQVKPKGVVLFHFKKLTITTQGDGQKTYRDLLTHSTQFNDAGEWGKLDVVVSNGRVQGRQIKQEPVTAMETPKDLFPAKGESARPLAQKGDEVMGSLKTYYSTAATEKRISEREAAVERFSQEYGDNIRKDFLSLCLIPLKYLFWFLAIIGGAFWVASYISAKESAIFSNGIPVFGTIQNWVHGWSAGVLYLIVMLYAVVYILYSTLAWIIPIQAVFVAIPFFIGNVALTASVAHRIIPNKRVRGGQNFTGANAPGQRQIGM